MRSLVTGGRVLLGIGWAVAVVMVAMVVTQLAGSTPNKFVAALQALTPYLLGASLPLGAVALVVHRWSLAAVCGAVAVVFVVLSWPLLHPPGQPEAAAATTPVRVFHANLLFRNERSDEVAAALEHLDADVLALAEYTPEHAAAMHDSAVLVERYPHRVEYPEPDAADGAAVWSRYPLTELPAPRSESKTVLATVGAPEPFTLLVVHTNSPFISMDNWRRELGHLTDPTVVDPRSDVPLLVVGDLNTTYWHPRYRELLDSGWRSAHQAHGRGFSTSWPNDIQPFPNYVRIDHALVNDHLVATDIDDIHVPGSDHVGFLVTVVAASR